jgi:hypothetical protein
VNTYEKTLTTCVKYMAGAWNMWCQNVLIVWMVLIVGHKCSKFILIRLNKLFVSSFATNPN